MSRPEPSHSSLPGPDDVCGPPAPDGSEVIIRRSPRRRRTVSARREHGRILVLTPARLPAGEERRLVARVAASVVERERRAATATARGDNDLLARALDLHARHLRPRVPDAPVPVSVRWVSNQHRRWGSCSPSERTIRISDRLRPLPGWVSDHVLLHELTHLVEREHNARFWDLLSATPHAERARGFLEGWQARDEAREA